MDIKETSQFEIDASLKNAVKNQMEMYRKSQITT